MNNNERAAGSTAHQVIYNNYVGHDLSDSVTEVDLRELWGVVWRGKWIVAAVTAVFAVASVLYSLSLPNIYQANAILAPSENADLSAMSGMAGQLGGLASLAGINFGPGAGGGNVAVAIEVMKSRRFITDFVEKHDILPDLIAVDDWDPLSNEVSYDPSLYDKKEHQWVRDVEFPKKPKPSDWEAYKAFSEILTITRNTENGLVTVSLQHRSPYVAQEWVTLLVEEVNSVMKGEDMEEAQKSIQYLERQLQKVSLAEMRTAFYQLIEEQTKKLMLAEVRDEYVFSTIDPPVVPEERVSPRRALICVLGVLIGGILSVAGLFIWHFSQPRPHRGSGAT